VVGIALGYEDVIDHDQLRHDPVMAVLGGKLEAKRSDCAPLAGKSTLNRLELSRAEPSRYHKISYDAWAFSPRIGLAHTQFARASCGTIRLKLLKIGALVRTSMRRIKLAMPSAFPYRAEYRAAHAALTAAATA
jgi:hypothetical protein